MAPHDKPMASGITYSEDTETAKFAYSVGTLTGRSENLPICQPLLLSTGAL